MRGGENGFSVRHQDAAIWIRPAITSGQYANLSSFGRECSCNPFDKRSFPGSARREVTNAYDGSVETHGAECAPAVQQQPSSDDRAIQSTQRRQYDWREGLHGVCGFGASTGSNRSLALGRFNNSSEINPMVLSAAP